MSCLFLSHRLLLFYRTRPFGRSNLNLIGIILVRGTTSRGYGEEISRNDDVALTFII